MWAIFIQRKKPLLPYRQKNTVPLGKFSPVTKPTTITTMKCPYPMNVWTLQINILLALITYWLSWVNVISVHEFSKIRVYITFTFTMAAIMFCTLLWLQSLQIESRGFITMVLYALLLEFGHQSFKISNYK